MRVGSTGCSRSFPTHPRHLTEDLAPLATNTTAWNNSVRGVALSFPCLWLFVPLLHQTEVEWNLMRKSTMKSMLIPWSSASTNSAAQTPIQMAGFASLTRTAPPPRSRAADCVGAAADQCPREPLPCHSERRVNAGLVARLSRLKAEHGMGPGVGP
jgi:hypothetical protein